MFLMKRDSVIDNRLESLIDGNETQKEVQRAIRLKLVQFLDETDTEQAKSELLELKTLAEIHSNLKTRDIRVADSHESESMMTLGASVLSFAILLLFENRHVLPKAVSWIRRV